MRKLIIILLALTLFLFVSCKENKKGRFYEVKSETIEGKKAIEDYKIRYYSPDTWTILGSDLKRSEGVFVYLDQVTTDSSDYKIISDESISKLSLQPHFSWWQRFGIWIAIPLGIILLLARIFLDEIIDRIWGLIISIFVTPFALLSHWIKKHW